MIGSLLPRCLTRTGQIALTVAVAAVMTLHGCGGDDLECGGPFCVSPPKRPLASSLAAGPGDGQQGEPGQELPESLGVKVTDEEGRPVSGITVSFSVSSGGGRLSSESATSDNQGLARVSWTLGGEIGTQRVSAAAADSNDAPLNGSPLELSAVATQPQAAELVLRSGLPETVQNSVPFEQQPIVDVLDRNGRPVSGVEVTVSVGSGGGSVTGSTSATSDENGAATFTNLALTGPQGAQTLRFAVS